VPPLAGAEPNPIATGFIFLKIVMIPALNLRYLTYCASGRRQDEPRVIPEINPRFRKYRIVLLPYHND
jgi:hypothetical protein